MIELTSKASGRKILINPDKIIAVYDNRVKGHESNLIVDCGNDDYFQVTESYEQVRSLLDISNDTAEQDSAIPDCDGMCVKCYARYRCKACWS